MGFAINSEPLLVPWISGQEGENRRTVSELTAKREEEGHFIIKLTIIRKEPWAKLGRSCSIPNCSHSRLGSQVQKDLMKRC
jgi:hypothetical protein